MSEETVVFEFSGDIPDKTRKAKVINEYSMDGKFICSYPTITAAALANNVSSAVVSNCCSGITLNPLVLQKIFLYADDDIKERIKAIKDKTSYYVTTHPVREYLLNGRHIKTWPNTYAVSQAFGIPYTTVKRVIKGSLFSIKNRIFLGGEDKIEDRIALIEQKKQKDAEKENLLRAAEEEMKIKVYTSDGEYLSTCGIPEAIHLYDVSRNDINNCLNGKALVTKHLIFLFNDDSIEERMERVRNRKTWKRNL